MKTNDEIINLLSQINDPEIPVINIVELGIIRDVRYENDLLVIDMTPTYSACPAVETIKQEICSLLIQHKIPKFEINIVHSPAWTTDWITEEALVKLANYGIAPPTRISHSISVMDEVENIICPYCKSEAAEMKSYFGSTACKSLYYCRSCNQPFEHFKRF